MADVQKMFRTIINSQSLMKAELKQDIEQLGKRLDDKVDKLQKEMRDGFGKVNQRIDKLGSDLAYLEDDAPTRKELSKLERRVNKVERKIASV